MHLAGKARVAAAAPAAAATAAPPQVACGGSGGGQAPGGAMPRGGTVAATAGGMPLHRASSEAPRARRTSQLVSGDRDRPRWADAGIPADAVGGDEDASEYADEDGAWDEWDEEDQAGVEEEPTPSELRAHWQRECRVVKQLEAQGVPAESTALAAARAARDEAEARWRDKKAPQPLSIRMGWAQKKLDRAEQALSKARLDSEAYEEEVERRRKDLDAKIELADQRYRMRWAQMQELHDEAAGNSTSASRPDESLCTMVARELQALTELLNEGSEERGKANLLLSKLASAVAGPSPQSYDMAQGDANSDEEMGCTSQGSEERRGGRGAPGTTTEAGVASESSWRTDATGRWNRSARDHLEGRSRPADGAADARADGRKQGAAVGEVPAPPTPAAADAHGPNGQHSAPPRTCGLTRTREDVHQGPPSKSHRGEDDATVQAVEAAGDDAARAAKLHQEQTAAIELARAANAKFGDGASVQIAAQLYAHKVELAKARAVAIGLDTTVGERQLIELSPEQFNAWVLDKLSPAEEAAAQKAKDEDNYVW